MGTWCNNPSDEGSNRSNRLSGPDFRVFHEGSACNPNVMSIPLKNVQVRVQLSKNLGLGLQVSGLGGSDYRVRSRGSAGHRCLLGLPRRCPCEQKAIVPLRGDSRLTGQSVDSTHNINCNFVTL